jgi:hypothetical protein
MEFAIPMDTASLAEIACRLETVSERSRQEHANLLLVSTMSALWSTNLNSLRARLDTAIWEIVLLASTKQTASTLPILAKLSHAADTLALQLMCRMTPPAQEDIVTELELASLDVLLQETVLEPPQLHAHTYRATATTRVFSSATHTEPAALAGSVMEIGTVSCALAQMSLSAHWLLIHATAPPALQAKRVCLHQLAHAQAEFATAATSVIKETV